MNRLQSRKEALLCSKSSVLLLLLLALLCSDLVQGFSSTKINANTNNNNNLHGRNGHLPQQRPTPLKASSSSAAEAAPKGFGAVQEQPRNEKEKNSDNRPVQEIKQELLDLLQGMQGNQEDFRHVERLVNALEANYVPAQTLGFLNMAMAGEWQLLFSTNLLAAVANPAQFRLRELGQSIVPNNLEGTVTNQAVWDLAQEKDGVFDATGTFAVECSYTINQGARMVLDLEDHVLKPSRGSKIPSDVPGLVGRLHRSMPKELFDPQDHAMDTTYLDADLRIARMTGARLEGVRDIFVRQGSLDVAPSSSSSTTTSEE